MSLHLIKTMLCRSRYLKWYILSYIFETKTIMVENQLALHHIWRYHLIVNLFLQTTPMRKKSKETQIEDFNRIRCIMSAMLVKLTSTKPEYLLTIYIHSAQCLLHAQNIHMYKYKTSRFFNYDHVLEMFIRDV